VSATPLVGKGLRRRGLRRLAVTVLAFFGGFLVAEIGVRALGIEVTHPPEARGNVFAVSSDPQIGFVNNPGATLVLDYRGDRASGPQLVRHEINSQGFRGPVVTPAPAAGVLRIACVGDSHTFGHGVAEHQTWPAHFARALAAQLPGRRFEVMNCGVSAHDTPQEASFLASEVLPYEPHLILVQFHLNDIKLRGVEGAHKAGVGLLTRLSSPHAGGWIRALRTRSRCFDLVLDGVYRKQGLGAAIDALTREYVEAGPRWRRLCTALLSMRDQLEEREIGFAVVLYPYLLKDGEFLASHDAFAVVREFCRVSRIECYDTEEAFLAHDDVEGLRVHPTDVHAGALAHRYFANSVADQILEERGLAPR